MPFGRKVGGNWNEHNVNIWASNDWRVSLVPVVVVIPAPRVYTKAVAVKTLVVEFQPSGSQLPARRWGDRRGGGGRRLGVVLSNGDGF